MGDHDTTVDPLRFSVLDETDDQAMVCTSLSDDDAVRQANKRLGAGARWGLGSGVEACGRWPDSHRHVRMWR